MDEEVGGGGMNVARVVGNVWATQKHSSLERSKLLLVQNLNPASGEVVGDVALAVDKYFDAGPGDTVLLMDEGSSARQILNAKSAPVRLVICGVVDELKIKNKVVKYH